MPESLTPEKFIKDSDFLPIIDVRSPSEYNQAHIPGAVNIPLFNDEERAKIGTLYKHEGKIIAVQNGLKIVGPKLAGFTKIALKLGSDEVLVHCWRGGMRSSSMAWLLETVGLKCKLLEGGYKAYRNFVLDSFKEPLKIILVGGMTGSGKTEILEELKKAGEQVIDLEGLANHKGSAFGAMGQEEQPRSEYFEHLLFNEFRKLDKSQPIWIEDESKNVGKVFLPQELWDQMRSAPLLKIDTTHEIRLERLVRDYTCFSKEELIYSIQKIEKRLGYDKCKEAVKACQDDNLKEAVRICLAYYDKLYSHQLETRFGEKLKGLPSIEVSTLDSSSYTNEIINKKNLFY